MSDLIIRAAEAQDLPAIVAMLADDVLGQSREDPSLPLAPGYVEAFAAITARPDHHLVVAVDGGEVVGAVQLTFIPGLSRQGAFRGIIEGVRVRADRRGRGIGAKLMDWAAETARARGGCPFLQLTTDKSRADAQRFYRRYGFEPSHEGMKLKVR